MQLLHRPRPLNPAALRQTGQAAVSRPADVSLTVDTALLDETFRGLQQEELRFNGTN